MQGTRRSEWTGTRAVALLAVGLAVVVSATARAGTPFPLAQQSGPGFPDVEVGVDSGGNAHAAWSFSEERIVRYCTVPAAMQACAQTRALAGQGTLREVLVDASDRVVIVTTDDADRTLAWTSADGFAQPVVVGADPGPGGWDFAALGPGTDSISLGRHVSAFEYSRAPLAGPAGQAVELPGGDIAPANTFGTELAVAAGTTPVIAAASTHQVTPDQFLLSVAYTSHPGGGDPAGGGWRPWRFFEGEFPEVAGGPNGAVVNYRTSFREPDGVLARKLDPLSGEFGPEEVVFDAALFEGPPPLSSLSANPVSGAFLAATRTGGTICVSGSDDGSGWSRPVAIASGTDASGLEAAAAADGRGLAVWADLAKGLPMAAGLDALPGAACRPGGGDPVEIATRRRLPVNRKGATRVKLGCPAGGPACAGTLKLVTARSASSSAAASRSRVLARSRFSVGAGETRRVKLKLARAKLRLLRRRPAARRAKLIAKLSGAGAKGKVVKKVRLAVPRAK